MPQPWEKLHLNLSLSLCCFSNSSALSLSLSLSLSISLSLSATFPIVVQSPALLQAFGSLLIVVILGASSISSSNKEWLEHSWCGPHLQSSTTQTESSLLLLTNDLVRRTYSTGCYIRIWKLMPQDYRDAKRALPCRKWAGQGWVGPHVFSTLRKKYLGASWRNIQNFI